MSNNGDMWTTSTGLFVRIAGSTVGPLGSGTIGGSITSTQIAFGSGSNIIQGSAALTATTTSGALIISQVAGNSTTTSATNAFSATISYTGAIASAAVASGIYSAPTGTPGSSSLGYYTAAYLVPSVSSAANNNASGAAIIGAYIIPTFSTAYTSTGTVLLAMEGVNATNKITSSNTSGTNTISNVYGFATSLSAVASGGGSLVVTNYYGLYMSPPTLTSATISNNYAVYQSDSTAMNSFAGTMTVANSTFSTASAMTALNVTPTFTGTGFVNYAALGSTATYTPSAASTASYYGVYCSSTITSSANVFAAGVNQYGGLLVATFNTQNTTNATVLASLTGLQVNLTVGSSNATGTNTITNVYGLLVFPGTWTSSGGGGLTVTNYYGLWLGTSNLSTTTITNRYGIWQNDPIASNYFAGNILITGGISDNNITSSSFSTGGNTTIANSVYTLLNSNSGTIATYTVTMPTTPHPGQKVRFVSNGTITTLTVSPSAGQSMGANAATTISIGSSIEYVYSGTTWYRVR